MSKVVCKNCGGIYEETLTKCPYCSTINRKGAYRDFRERMGSFVDKVFGLQVSAYDSVHKYILTSILRGLLTAAICIGIGGVFGALSNVNYYNDKEYDQETLEDILWEDENLDTLEAAYASGDYDRIEALIRENSRVVYNWEHYSAYELKAVFSELICLEQYSEYDLRDVLYYLYFPNYYVNTNRMSESEYQEYLDAREELLVRMKSFGYSETELKEIYDSCHDSYGYLSAADIREKLEEES